MSKSLVNEVGSLRIDMGNTGNKPNTKPLDTQFIKTFHIDSWFNPVP